MVLTIAIVAVVGAPAPRTPAAVIPPAAARDAAPAGQGPTFGVIRGRVEIRRPAPAPDRRPDVTGLSMPTPRDPAERRQAVVYLETAPRPALEPLEPVRARLDQRNETFVPHVLAIPVGSTVEFPNNDTVYHNVFSLSKARRFDLGRYPAGQSKSVRFDTPGVVRVFCEIHSHMNAYILIFGHRFFTVTDDDGRFGIERVPPGSYTVTAWYEGIEVDSRQVAVGAGEAVDLTLVVR